VSGNQPAVVCRTLSHTYRDDDGNEVRALDQVDLQVRTAEAVALVGPSGAGKSTLLSLLAGLVRPTSGRILVGGTEVTRLTERELLRLRARLVGMLLQTPGRNLLPYATSAQNVGFAQRTGTASRTDRRTETRELLESVGLAEHADRQARLLSGGQQQRLALAVALAGRPAVLLADEPTSQLDRVSGDMVIALMLAARKRHGTALIVVTHDHHVSARMDAAYTIHDGNLTGEPWLGSSTSQPQDPR
jgi:ABC-type lipoprotein export system ATPase subunit